MVTSQASDSSRSLAETSNKASRCLWKNVRFTVPLVSAVTWLIQVSYPSISSEMSVTIHIHAALDALNPKCQTESDAAAPPLRLERDDNRLVFLSSLLPLVPEWTHLLLSGPHVPLVPAELKAPVQCSPCKKEKKRPPTICLVTVLSPVWVK